ncbi:MAG: hypothetical protein ACREBI_05165 [Nitrosotalea sp.]
MKKQTLAITAILAAASIFGIVYASSTSISDTAVSTTTVNAVNGVYSNDVNTTNLFVTGTCTGCGVGGASEGNFNSYNTIASNKTAGSGAIDDYIYEVMISNIGTVSFEGSLYDKVFKFDGTLVYENADSLSYGYSGKQSITGEYQIVVHDFPTPGVSVFKNGVYLQDLGLNLSQFQPITQRNEYDAAISPDGEYIVVVAPNVNPNPGDRVVIFQGS